MNGPQELAGVRRLMEGREMSEQGVKPGLMTAGDALAEDLRELRKWLNEEPSSAINRQALARVLAAADAAQASAEGEAGLPLWIGGKLTDEEIRDLRACVAAQVHRAVLTAHPAPAPAVTEGFAAALKEFIDHEARDYAREQFGDAAEESGFISGLRHVAAMLAAAPEAPAPSTCPHDGQCHPGFCPCKEGGK